MIGLQTVADFQHAVRIDANSASFLRGSISALANWPRSALLVFFGLAKPEPS
jgi:hypothetical protein